MRSRACWRAMSCSNRQRSGNASAGALLLEHWILATAPLYLDPSTIVPSFFDAPGAADR
jgi:hypothetical protein